MSKSIQQFPTKEQETTIDWYRGDKKVLLYTSDSTMITKISKLVDEKDIQVLTTDKNGRITSMKTMLDFKQLSFRNKPKSNN